MTLLGNDTVNGIVSLLSPKIDELRKLDRYGKFFFSTVESFPLTQQRVELVIFRKLLVILEVRA